MYIDVVIGGSAVASKTKSSISNIPRRMFFKKITRNIYIIFYSEYYIEHKIKDPPNADLVITLFDLSFFTKSIKIFVSYIENEIYANHIKNHQSNASPKYFGDITRSSKARNIEKGLSFPGVLNFPFIVFKAFTILGIAEVSPSNSTA